MCVSKHETFLQKVQILSNFVFRVFEGKEKKGGFDIIYETHLCSRASERERKRERKKEREEEKKKEDEDRNVAKTTSLEKGSHFLRRRRSFSKKKPFAFECAKGILSNLGVYNA